MIVPGVDIRVQDLLMGNKPSERSQRVFIIDPGSIKLPKVEVEKSRFQPEPLNPSDITPATWGERWRYDDPLHAFGAIPIVGIPYRLAVIGASYLLDLATAEQQGITPIQFDDHNPGWLDSHF